MLVFSYFLLAVRRGAAGPQSGGSRRFNPTNRLTAEEVPLLEVTGSATKAFRVALTVPDSA